MEGSKAVRRKLKVTRLLLILAISLAAWTVVLSAQSAPANGKESSLSGSAAQNLQANIKKIEVATDQLILLPKDLDRVRKFLEEDEQLADYWFLTKGCDWWKTEDESRRVADLKRILTMSPGQRQGIISAGEEHQAAMGFKSQGSYTDAVEHQTKSSETIRQVWGEGDAKYAVGLDSLADIFREWGHFNDAESLDRRAIAISKNALGERNPEYAMDMHDLALDFIALGRLAEAEPLLTRTLEILKSASLEEDPYYALALSHLADLDTKQGQFVKAEALYRQAVAVRQKAGRTEDLEFSSLLNSQADLYLRMERYADAEPLYRQALEIVRKTSGEDHPSNAPVLSNLASLYVREGRFEEAEPLFLKAVAIDKKALGVESPGYATSLNNLGDFYLRQGRYKDAEPLFSESADISKKIFGDNSLQYAIRVNNQATVYQKEGKYQEAEPLATQAAQLFRKSLGSEHPDYAQSLLNLSTVYYKLKRYSDAESFCRQALEIEQKALGEESAEYAQALFLQSKLYETQERWNDAAQLYLKSMEIQWNYLARNLGSLSPRQQQQWLMRGSINGSELLFGLVFTHHVSGIKGMQGVLWRKQLGMEALRQQSAALRNAVSTGTKEWSLEWDELQSLRREYANLSLRLQNQPARGTRMESASAGALEKQELERRIETLEVRLRQSNPAYVQFAKFQNVKVDDVRQALRSDEALVEYVRYRPFGAQNIGAYADSAAIRSWINPRYGVFILHGEKGEVQAIDLGSAAEMDKLLKQYRDAMNEAIKRFQATPSPQQLKTSEAELGKLSAELREKVWNPLESALPGVKRVYLAPDGQLSLMPFEALAQQQPDGNWRYLAEEYELVYVGTGRDLARLALRSATENGPSAKGTELAAVLIGAPAFGATPRELVVASAAQEKAGWQVSLARQNAANAGFNSGTLGAEQAPMSLLGGFPPTFPDVPELEDFTEKAGQSLKQRGWKVQMLDGRDASKQAVLQLQHPALLQFASHGFFAASTDTPGDKDGAKKEDEGDDALLHSALILAGYNRRLDAERVFYRVGNEILSANQAKARGLKEEDLASRKVEADNGVLTAYEVTGMDLDGTRLVNLTACETGVGSVTAEGVVGLRGGFLLAGARAITMSMWGVPVEETTQQMLDFYGLWLGSPEAQNLPGVPYQAFHKSQLAALNRARKINGAGHPFLWAGTVYVGDPGDLPAATK